MNACIEEAESVFLPIYLSPSLVIIVLHLKLFL